MSTIPEGAVCYLDAAIFYYHLVEAATLSEECSDLLQRIEVGQVHGVTSTVALAEATHKVMLADIVHRHGVPHQGLIARLKRHPALLEGVTRHEQVATTVQGLPVQVEAITLALLVRGAPSHSTTGC